MERAITASEANQHFSDMLRQVQEGNSFVVTSRGRPVAKMVPVDDLEAQGRRVREMLARLDKLPIVTAKPWAREELYESHPDDFRD